MEGNRALADWAAPQYISFLQLEDRTTHKTEGNDFRDCEGDGRHDCLGPAGSGSRFCNVFPVRAQT